MQSKSIIRLAFLLLIFVALSARAQQFTVEIIRPAPLQKDALFTQTVLWVADSFRSAREVIGLKDKELGTIIGNGAFDMNIGVLSFMPAVNVPVTFKMRIDVKDNRYRMNLFRCTDCFGWRSKAH